MHMNCSSSSEPHITVALCTFNRSQMLRATLESLFAQDTRGITFEIVVIDDGSTDDTSSVVEALQKDALVPLRYIAQPNSGVGRARNRAVEEARAPWIAFIDDDEVASGEWLFELHDAVVTNNADGAGGPCLLRVLGQSAIQPVGTVSMLMGEIPNMRGDAVKLSLFDRLRFRTTKVAHPGGGNALVKRSLVEDIGGFQETSYGEDLDFFRRAERHGAVFATAPKAWVYHLMPADRLLPGRLYALARRAGHSQAALDGVHSHVGRRHLLSALRLVHASLVTIPALIFYSACSDRSQVVSRLCSLRFASAYIQTCLRAARQAFAESLVGDSL